MDGYLKSVRLRGRWYMGMCKKDLIVIRADEGYVIAHIPSATKLPGYVFRTQKWALQFIRKAYALPFLNWQAKSWDGMRGVTSAKYARRQLSRIYYECKKQEEAALERRNPRNYRRSAQAKRATGAT